MKIETIEIEGLSFYIYHHEGTDLQSLNEAKKKGQPLTGTYTYDLHQAHNPTGEYHLHLYDKGNEILSINKVSGTGHDGYHGTRIPNKAFKALKAKFSDWKWPSDQIIESLDYTYIVQKDRLGLRPVKVFTYRDSNLQTETGFDGYFHQFANDPFLTGGGGGWVDKTIALIETQDGHIKKVPADSFRFLDTKEYT